MQRLTRPDTLWPAAAGATVTTLGCAPRLHLWTERPDTLGVLLSALFLCSFVLWGFVFAWSPNRSWAWLRPPRDPHLWTVAALGGAAGAALLAVAIDPELRSITPTDYPANATAWIAGTLFTLTFTQLFLCFAPLAFFLRLLRHPFVAAAATLCFSVFLLGLQLRQIPVSLSTGFTLALLTVRLLSGSFALYLLLRGGPWPIWLAAFLMQLRLLPDFR